jgi:hypothetical protein
MTRRVLALLAVLLLTAGFTACGGDDDDDTVVEDDSSEETTDDEDMAADDEDMAAEFDAVAFCTKLRESDDREAIPLDEIEADVAQMQDWAASAPAEISEDVQFVADLGQSVVDNASADPVPASEIEGAAAGEGVAEAFGALQSYCDTNAPA